jgi:hypothetical protein
MGKAERFLKYWRALFCVLSKQAKDCKVYILGLTPSTKHCKISPYCLNRRRLTENSCIFEKIMVNLV